jgi:glycerol kinase
MTYLVFDQGTSSLRSIVFDERGHIAQARLSCRRRSTPNPAGWEHDLLEIWRSQLPMAREALHKAGLKAMTSGALGITNQRETTVPDRRTGQPVHHAIVWQGPAEDTCASNCAAPPRSPHPVQNRLVD